MSYVRKSRVEDRGSKVEESIFYPRSSIINSSLTLHLLLLQHAMDGAAAEPDLCVGGFIHLYQHAIFARLDDFADDPADGLNLVALLQQLQHVFALATFTLLAFGHEDIEHHDAEDDR